MHTAAAEFAAAIRGYRACPQQVLRSGVMARITKRPPGQHINVAIAVVVHSGQALFVRRLSPLVPEYHGKWELPGGKLEPEEAPESTMVREVWEETGFRTCFVRLLPLRYTAHLVLMEPPLTVDVQCGICSLSQAPQRTGRPEPIGRGSHEYAWFGFEEIPYENVIPGSKEFILWTSNELNYDIPSGAGIYNMALESVDHRINRRREYQISLTFRPERPAGPFELETRYGRKQSWQRVQRATFATMEQALREAMRRVAQRKHHGYSVVNVEDNHPLRSWLHLIEVPEGETAYPKLFDDRPLLN